MLSGTTAVHLQFDGFVPVDDITRQTERLKANDVYIAAFCTDVDPLALKRQMTVTNSAHNNISSLSHNSAKNIPPHD